MPHQKKRKSFAKSAKLKKKRIAFAKKAKKVSKKKPVKRKRQTKEYAPTAKENLRKYKTEEATESMADALAEGIAVGEVAMDATGPVPLAEESYESISSDDLDDESINPPEDSSDDEGYF